jgi:hypothetical protein
MGCYLLCKHYRGDNYVPHSCLTTTYTLLSFTMVQVYITKKTCKNSYYHKNYMPSTNTQVKNKLKIIQYYV